MTGMVAQEILDACEEAAAATGGGGGGGSSETNLANPALGRYRYRFVGYSTVRFGAVYGVYFVRRCGRARFCRFGTYCIIRKGC